MKVFVLILSIFFGSTMSFAQDVVEQNRLQVYDAEYLDALDARLLDEARADAQMRGRIDFFDVATHRFVMRHRVGPTGAEQHPDVTDVIFVKSGTAAIRLGGDIVDPIGEHGELSGKSIEGGRIYSAGAGDIFNVPPNVAHQWIIEDGESISYYILKVKE